MTTFDVAAREDGTVKDRLIRAADAEIAKHGMVAVQMETVARSAGVSRATAFRQLGSVSEMLVQVALLRVRRHVSDVTTLMNAKSGAFAKLEAALIYTAREVPNDPSISALIAQHSESVHDPRMHRVAVEAVGPVLQEGQRNGEVRNDLDIGEVVDFLVEQSYLAAEEIDRSEAEVQRRFRHFIIPALAASGESEGEQTSRTREVEDAVDVAIGALSNLADQLRRGRTAAKSGDWIH